MNEDKAREAFEARSSNINYERNDYGEYVDVWTEGEWQEFKDGWIAALQWAASQQAAEGWRPISEAPENMARQVVVFWLDREGNEQTHFDYTEDGCWMEWHNHAEHVEIIGGHGVSYTPPYTHWMPLPTPPSTQGGADEQR